MEVALASFSGNQVVFEVGIAFDGREWCERGAPQVRVQHDAGGVDHPRERRAFQGFERVENRFNERARFAAGADLLTRRVEDLPDCADDQGMRETAGRQGKPPEQLIDGRKRGQIH
jgi:hypothetical protein